MSKLWYKQFMLYMSEPTLRVVGAANSIEGQTSGLVALEALRV